MISKGSCNSTSRPPSTALGLCTDIHIGWCFMMTKVKPPTSGPILLVIGISILGFSDNLLLIVSDSASVGQFHFIRSIFIVFGILLVSKMMGLPVVPQQWTLMLTRTFCMVSAILLYFIAMPLMPIAEAGAGLFTSPIFVLIFSSIFLKEAIGLRQTSVLRLASLIQTSQNWTKQQRR